MAVPKTFAESLAKRLAGKHVELYLADSSRKLKFADFESNQNTVVRGKLVGAEGDILIIECYSGPASAEIYINGYHVIGAMERTAEINVDSIFFETARKRKR